MNFIELLKMGNIVVTLRPWSENFWYFQVTREVKEPGSQWFQCTTLKRTLPIYNLKLLNKLLKGNRYKAFFDKKAKSLCMKYQ